LDAHAALLFVAIRAATSTISLQSQKCSRTSCDSGRTRFGEFEKVTSACIRACTGS